MTITIFHNEECQKHSNKNWPVGLLFAIQGMSGGSFPLLGSAPIIPMALGITEYFIPERSHRTRKFFEHFNSSERYDFRRAEPIDEEAILKCHTKKVLDRLKHPRYSDALSGMLGVEINHQTYNSAVASAGIAYEAANAAVTENESSLYFGLCRPPGHHASVDTIKGFCYLNNMNIALVKLLNEGKIGNALILDFDAHVGNGGLDLAAQIDKITYLDVPLLMGKRRQTPREYLQRMECILGEHVKQEYDLVGMCAGFDAHEGHPMFQLGNFRINNGFPNIQVTIGHNNLRDEHYIEIGKLMKQFTSEVSSKKPFAILEGGYHPTLYRTIDAFCQTFE